MIHKYTMNGVYIAMDINGGSVHVLDEITYDLLDFYTDIRDGRLSMENATKSLKKYTKEELDNMSWDEVKYIGRMRQVFNRNRDIMTTQILKFQDRD